MRPWGRSRLSPFSGRLRLLFAGLVVLAVGAVAILLRPTEPLLAGRAYAVDGDTLRLAGQRVRLLGIDAPELAQTCTHADGTPWPCGAAARDLLAGLVTGTQTTCRPDGRDHYGRTLAHCSVAGADLGKAVVEAGLATAEFEYLFAEWGARSARAGIWEGSFEPPSQWRAEHEKPSL